MTTITPDGLCLCGCGERTRLAPQSSTRFGWVAGQPQRYIHGHHRRKSGVPFTVEDRGHTTPCHIWARTTSGRGYGYTTVDGRTVGAHIAYYERAYGPVPAGLELDHLCRQRACVNADHLQPVTRAENVRRGSLAKLTSAQVAEIRAATRERGSGRSLAVRYGVSATTISEIRNGKTWAEACTNT